MSFPGLDHLSHVGVCETWIRTHRREIYFKLKIKDRPPSMCLVNGSALVEFRIQEKKRQVLIRILYLVNGRDLSLARNQDLFQGHPGLCGTVQPSNFTMDAPGLTVSLASLSRCSLHLAALSGKGWRIREEHGRSIPEEH